MDYERLPEDGTQRWLLIIARPRDECYYFAPLLKDLAKHKQRVRVLCLSCGPQGDGEDKQLLRTRKEELTASCAVFGIAAEDVKMVNDPALVWEGDWPAHVIEKYIQQAVEEFHPTGVITFDDSTDRTPKYHVFCHNGLKQFLGSRKSGEEPLKVWILRTVPCWIRHNSRWTCVLSWSARRHGWTCYHEWFARTARRGLAHHKSQQSFGSTMEKIFFVPMRFNAIMDATATQLQGQPA